MEQTELEKKAEEYAQDEINKMFVDESEEVYVRESTLKQIIKNSHLKGLAEDRKENEELKNVVKLLITTLNDTTWDEGHPGYADSEPGYRCPNCSCKDCYRISCKYNESELFKKMYRRFPEL